MTTTHCLQCNYSLQGYAETETVCGACFDAMNTKHFTAPAAVVDALMTAHHALGTAQTAANGWDRAGLGRELDRIRWALGDLIAQVEPLTGADALDPETGVWEPGESHPFTNATGRG